MRYKNITPEDYVERHFCSEIFRSLNFTFKTDDVMLFVRSWDQKPEFPKQKYISIVTSAEGHTYIPEEAIDPNCMGVFMNYYPKKSLDFQFTPDNFLAIDNVFPLPLGETKFFNGHPNIPIQARTIDVSFVGQLDPYRRLDFYNAVAKYAEHIDNSVFHFYEGWNNGIGEKYSEIMSNTKIALIPCGSASLDTFRYSEAARCGCVLLTCPQNNYDYMIHPTHLTIPSWGFLKEMVDLILQNKKELVRRSRETIEYWEECLSPSGAANYILDKVRE